MLNVIGGKDPKTVLLLHANGADASTTFTDSSRSAHTVTPVGNAQIDTAQSVFGGASALFDGTGDYLTVADHADFEFGTGDFTIDFRFRTTSVAASRGVLAKDDDAGDVFGPYRFQNVSGAFRFSSSSNGSSFDIANGRLISNVLVNTWYHIAVVRSGTTFFSFLDGVQQDTWTSSASLINNAQPVRIGVSGSLPSGESYHIGWLDEIRFSKGVARWDSNFTPPTSAYR